MTRSVRPLLEALAINFLHIKYFQDNAHQALQWSNKYFYKIVVICRVVDENCISCSLYTYKNTLSVYFIRCRRKREKQVKTNVLLTKLSCFIKFYNQRNEAHSTLYSIFLSSSMCSSFQSYTKKTEIMKRKYILFISKSFEIRYSVDLYQKNIVKKCVRKKSRKRKLTYCFKKCKNNNKNNFFFLYECIPTENSL